MVTLASLWLPIVLAAVAVFVVSSLVHMVFTYHRSDYKKLPSEDKVLEAMRGAAVAPGAYHFPHAPDMKALGSPEMIEKFKRGPVGIAIVRPSGPPAMGLNLGLWFGFCLLVGLLTAYLAAHSLAAGAPYLEVFRVTGTAALLGYCAGDLVDTIWKSQPWSTTLKGLFDGLLYALVTAGVFGWLWPA